MKILHTSDWHLGMKDGERSLYDDQVYFIDNICRIAEEQEVDLVVIAGDIFDRSVPSAEAINLYDMAMTKLCVDCGREVALIAGNHDSSDRIENCNKLLARAGLHVAGAIKGETKVIRYEEADVYLLPWFTESKVRSLFDEESDDIGSLQDACKILCGRIEKELDRKKKNILVTHAFLTSSETSKSDRAAELAFAEQVGAEVFRAFDYVALGHIHKPQEVGENARYSGTPMPYSFGKEENQIKSVTVIDTDSMERTVIPVELLHLRKTVRGTLDEILEGDFTEDVLNGYTRIEVTDRYVGREALSAISGKFRNFVEVIGKTFEDGESTIRLTVDELRELESNPIEIFKSFYRDVMAEEPEERLIDMFEECIEEGEEISI